MKKTGFNSDLMLLSLNLYAKLNCASKMIQLLVDLDIKSVQYDSMGYICFPHLARLDPGMLYNSEIILPALMLTDHNDLVIIVLAYRA